MALSGARRIVFLAPPSLLVALLLAGVEGLARLRRDISWLEPDVVTALFGWNDIGRRNLEDAEAMPTSWPMVTARHSCPPEGDDIADLSGSPRS